MPEPDPENRVAIRIRSARPPIITVIGASPVGSYRLKDKRHAGLLKAPPAGQNMPVPA